MAHCNLQRYRFRDFNGFESAFKLHRLVEWIALDWTGNPLIFEKVPARGEGEWPWISALLDEHQCCRHLRDHKDNFRGKRPFIGLKARSSESVR